MLLAEEQTSQHNQIVSRFADAPEGPWSDDIVVYDVADPAFRNLYYATMSTWDAYDAVLMQATFGS